jgi:hypothetical protein
MVMPRVRKEEKKGSVKIALLPCKPVWRCGRENRRLVDNDVPSFLLCMEHEHKFKRPAKAHSRLAQCP